MNFLKSKILNYGERHIFTQVYLKTHFLISFLTEDMEQISKQDVLTCDENFISIPQQPTTLKHLASAM
jgi:hypothetical protein